MNLGFNSEREDTTYFLFGQWILHESVRVKGQAGAGRKFVWCGSGVRLARVGGQAGARQRLVWRQTKVRLAPDGSEFGSSLI